MDSLQQRIVEETVRREAWHGGEKPVDICEVAMAAERIGYSDTRVEAALHGLIAAKHLAYADEYTWDDIFVTLAGYDTWIAASGRDTSFNPFEIWAETRA